MNARLDELRKLPIAEKLRIVEALWDDIAASKDPHVVRDWHIAEAKRRDAELDADPGIALTRDQLWQRVDELNG